MFSLFKKKDSSRYKLICKSCAAFIHDSDGTGRCHMNAPSMYGWPAVLYYDWCLQHTKNIRKVGCT